MLAYLNLIPQIIKLIPFYDSIGHFMLFGCLGLIADIAFKNRKIAVINMLVPVGPLVVCMFAVGDEFLQLTSNKRTFDLYDLGFSILGIVCFVFIRRAIVKNKAKSLLG